MYPLVKRALVERTYHILTDYADAVMDHRGKFRYVFAHKTKEVEGKKTKVELKGEPITWGTALCTLDKCALFKTKVKAKAAIERLRLHPTTRIVKVCILAIAIVAKQNQNQNQNQPCQEK